MNITGVKVSNNQELIKLARKWVEMFGLSRSTEVIANLADALEDSEKRLVVKTEAAKDHERNWIEASDAARTNHGSVLKWFAEKYAGFADKQEDAVVKYAYKTASALAVAEAESLGDGNAPITDEERVRVIRDILSYRLLPEPVIEYLNAYLAEVEGD